MTRVSRVWAALAVLLIVAACLVSVSITPPRVHVRWREGVTEQQRRTLEERYRLTAGERIEGDTWRYQLRDGSRDNVGALVRDPAVADTAYIDRETYAAPSREIHVSASRARALIGPDPSGLLQLQSVLLFAGGGLLLWAAGAPDKRNRRAAAIAIIAAIGAAAYAVSLHQPIRMGDSDTYTHSRESFELFSGARQLRFEAHLAHSILGRLDALYGRTDASPARAMRTLAHAATAWFVFSALLVGFVEGWSALVVRYLGLVMLAPSALLFFGYRELGQLSLSAAAFPLLARGIPHRTRHVEAGAALAGFGAALHGFGLLSLAGAALAGAVSRLPVRERIHLLIRIAAYGTAAYLGWVAIYLIVLSLPLVPGHAEAIPLRPWFVDQVGTRVNAGILSPKGARDILVEMWLVGVPLVLAAVPLRRRYRDEARLVAAYAIPSVLFIVAFWPIQGLAVEMDLVFAAFPATYALAWLCAHERRPALVAAGVLASAHLVFWRVVLDSAFVNSPIG